MVLQCIVGASSLCGNGVAVVLQCVIGAGT